MKRFYLFAIFIFLITASQAQNKTIKREKFVLQYSADWTIDTTDTDYDPDALFTLEAPDGGTMVMFILLDSPVDSDFMLKAQLNEFKSKLIKKPTSETPFSNWGFFEGKGVELKGKLLGAFKGTVRLFAWADKEKSMMIVTQYSDSDFTAAEKDLKLIESSFKFL